MQRQRQPLSQTEGALSTSALLASLHEVFVHNPEKSLDIDYTSALTVDTHVPEDLVETIWRHAWKQREDELLLLHPVHEAAHSLLLGALSVFPGIESRMLTAWTVLQPFLTAMTPQNLNQGFHNGVAFSLSLNASGEVVSARLKLSEQSLRNLDPLLNLPAQHNYRSFDVFYHMLYSQQEDPDRAEMLSLKAHPSRYALLRGSETFDLPSWVAFADDYALAKDWADAMQEVLPRSFQLTLVSILSGILLLGNGDENRDDLADGAALVGLDFATASKYPMRELVSATYVSLLQSVVTMLNRYLATLDLQAQGSDADSIFSVVTIAELASTPAHRLKILRAKFDNDFALNAEMAEDGLQLPKTPKNIIKTISRLGHERPPPQLTVIEDFRAILDPSAQWVKDDIDLSNTFDVDALMPSNRVWTVLSIASSGTAQGVAVQEAWASSIVSAQIRDMFITEWIARSKIIDYTADYESFDFVEWFGRILPPGVQAQLLSNWAETRFPPTGFFQGHQRVYLSENAWMQLENELNGGPTGLVPDAQYSQYSVNTMLPPPENAADVPQQVEKALHTFQQPEYEEGRYLDGDDLDEPMDYDDNDEALLKDFRNIEPGHQVEVHTQTRERKVWVIFVWLITFWIPSPLLNWFGRMRRRDVRLAWREKFSIFCLIVLLNLGIIFYMIVLGHLICPEYDKVWNHKELSYHQGTNDFYVGIHGYVYDITKFYTQQHSDNGIKTTSSLMLEFAGQDLSDYFPPPLTVACPSLVSKDDVKLTYNTTRSPMSEALHISGPVFQANNNTALHQTSWYDKVFKPSIKQYYKGKLVETPKHIDKVSANDSSRYFITLNKTIYDVSNYMMTIQQYPADESPYYEKYNFFPKAVTSLFENYQGMDITDKFNALDEKTRQNSLECLNNAFVYAYPDFRHTAKCQAANVILLVIAGLLTSITLVKFLASVRFGSKPMPMPQDKFVICQVPIYTEGEDDMRLAIDSLTNMKYDNRRKLLVLLCDGMITGSGNDRPTPEIVLDILGIDENRIDPEPKAYHSIAEGARELNYAKVYSGLYENDGDIVPYICIVKVGGPDESRPGNRGKRDSQLILMSFLNRVHYGDPMCPLDLEIFHHINNVIGVEPERYEYIFTVDADTKVMPDSLTRLVAACTADNSISAVCGETGIQNEQQSLSTMVQVYEYFISHHLTKAFESIFGSVTCLPGCFSLYRLRTVQRSRPLLISSDVIREYSLRHVDTLHKKNLFSLGEDRYLTTLMAKNFPRMNMKFVADAKCLTHVPNEFSILLSQRRRWINSTVHNLAELLRLKTMCGFFLFSMRGIVFTDLIGTLMLPSVVIYLVYLIYVLASHSSPLPLISIVLICSVYGLQALVFIMHRRWQHIFWMIVYIAAYPFHSFLLPIYSFWNMDDFGWGNTRVVIDESKGRKVVMQDEDDKYDPHKVPFEPWHSYALREGLPGRERPIVFDPRKGRIVRDVTEDPAIYNAWQESGGGGLDTLAGVEGAHDPEKGFFHSRSMSTPSIVTGRPASMYTMGGANAPAFDAGTAAQIRDTIQQVLLSTDLDTMTSRQLRGKVGDLLGTEFAGDRAAAVDAMIDDELERMDDNLIGSELEPFEIEEPAEGDFQEPSHIPHAYDDLISHDHAEEPTQLLESTIEEDEPHSTIKNEQDK